MKSTFRFFLLDITKSCDCVLWAGDMNFRIDMPHQEVLNLCKEQKYNEILLKDEFKIAQNKTGKNKLKKNIKISFIYCYIGGLYGDFKEASIEFPPTYKLDLRAADDTYSKHRTPSYTV